MLPRSLWRTTTFRLTLAYGLVFALASVLLLSIVYVQSTAFLTARVDRILAAHAEAMSRAPPDQVASRIAEALSLNRDQTNIYALFTARGARVAGNLARPPPGLRAGGASVDVPPSADFPAHARLIALRLADGEELVLGRDIEQLLQMRAIVARALAWSGALILVVGLTCGTALGLQPLRRLRGVELAARDIAAGRLDRRMPAGALHDELDMFAETVNHMLDELERLLAEVKAASDTVVHDLRTPLTRARARLHRLQQDGAPRPEDLARVTAEIDEVLERFRAITRISELEGRARRAGFSRVDLAEVARGVAELYLPLAEAEQVRLITRPGPSAEVEADGKLLFEALSNLVDNAIKFSPRGGTVEIALDVDGGAPRLVVRDEGPGIAPGERTAVLQRFYRGERARLIEGSGLGLSVVAAILRLHDFRLDLQDAAPGLRAVIACATSQSPIQSPKQRRRGATA